MPNRAARPLDGVAIRHWRWLPPRECMASDPARCRAAGSHRGQACPTAQGRVVIPGYDDLPGMANPASTGGS
jgi:hypothetical protein